MTARDHVDKIGILGAAFVALCCLGFSAVLSVVSAIGLGFLIHDAVLLPLLIISLLVMLWGLFSGWKRHRQPAVLIVGVIAALSLVVFSFVHPLRPVAFMSRDESSLACTRSSSRRHVVVVRMLGVHANGKVVLGECSPILYPNRLRNRWRPQA